MSWGQTDRDSRVFTLISGRLICLVSFCPLLTIQSHDLFTGADGENGEKKKTRTHKRVRENFFHIPPKRFGAWSWESCRVCQSSPTFVSLPPLVEKSNKTRQNCCFLKQAAASMHFYEVYAGHALHRVEAAGERHSQFVQDQGNQLLAVIIGANKCVFVIKAGLAWEVNRCTDSIRSSVKTILQTTQPWCISVSAAVRRVHIQSA